MVLSFFFFILLHLKGLQSEKHWSPRQKELVSPSLPELPGLESIRHVRHYVIGVKNIFSYSY